MNVTTSHIGRRRRAARQGNAPDLSDSGGLRHGGRRPHRPPARSRSWSISTPVELRRQRDDRLPHGSLPAGAGRRRHAQAGRACRNGSRRCCTMTGAHNFLEVHADRGVGPRELRRLAMRTITTTAGTPVDLDGDVLAVIEAISRDLARRQELDYGFEDVDREIPAPRRPDDPGRAAGVPEGKPVHELQPVRERAIGRARAKGEQGDEE